MRALVTGTSISGRSFRKRSASPASRTPCPARIRGRFASFRVRRTSSTVLIGISGSAGGVHTGGKAQGQAEDWISMGTCTHTGPGRPFSAR